MCRRTPSNKRTSKKPPSAHPSGCDRLPAGERRALGADEHRNGLKSILHKVWCFDGQRPLTPVQHHFEWRYLVGFVHPASWRTVFHLATTVSIPLFEVELAAFARQVGASPVK